MTPDSIGAHAMSGTAAPDPVQWITDDLAKHSDVDPRRVIVARWFGLLPAHPRLAGLTGALDAADRAAGVIRVRTDNEADVAKLARALFVADGFTLEQWYSGEYSNYHDDYWTKARAVLEALVTP